MMPNMLNVPEPACLVIADISGYTSYLAGVELDHAQDILADLMDTVVGSLRPAFRLAKLEGDAAFTYAVTATIDGSALMDTVERTYFSFRRRLRDIGQASTCDCNACIRMPTLDLKVLAHHGTIVRQRMAGREELVGSEVILAHRLLKNEVTKRTGATAYALYTDACLRAAGVDPATLNLIEHRETYEFIGEVTGWVSDLGAAWAAELDRTRLAVEPKAAIGTLEFDLPGPPAVTWEYLTSPARRPTWQVGVTEVQEQTANGRRGVGTTNHCVHGKDAVVEEILDWRPPEYRTYRAKLPDPAVPRFTATERLEDSPTGTHVTVRIERPRSTRDRAIIERLLPTFEHFYRAGASALRPLLEAEVARRAEDAADLPEPQVPASPRRFLDPLVDSDAARSS
jgi:uncharacterized protein YndB with AHSA1/START domain